MSTQSQNQENPKRSNEEFSKNYKRANQDGIFGPVAVGNINEFQGRMIINLCMKTVRSGEKNASYSQPSDWKLKAGTGDFVNVLVQNGYVVKLMPISPKPLSLKIAKAIEEVDGGDAALVSAKQIIEGAKSSTSSLEAELAGGLADSSVI